MSDDKTTTEEEQKKPDSPVFTDAMSKLPSGRPQVRVRSTCDGFSIPDDNRAPVDRDQPGIRKSIGAAPVSRPAKTQKITQHYAAAEVDWMTLIDKWLFWSAVVYLLYRLQ